jgi:hypothetical protein
MVDRGMPGGLETPDRLVVVIGGELATRYKKVRRKLRVVIIC